MDKTGNVLFVISQLKTTVHFKLTQAMLQSAFGLYAVITPTPFQSGKFTHKMF
jgi:hypothetical protein